MRRPRALHHPPPSRPRQGPASLAALIALLCTAPGFAGVVYVGLPDAELADGAGAIVLGRVEERAVVERGGVPWQRHRLRVERWLRGAPDPGAPADVAVVGWPGGVGADGVALHVAGAPDLAPDDRVLLFLDRRGDGTFALHQWSLGAFRLVPSGGRILALRDLSEARELVLPRRARPRDGPRHAGRFVDWLDARARGRSTAADYFLDTGVPVPRFRIATSSTAPLPEGCGDNGGHELRVFDFDTGDAVDWRSHFRGLDSLEEGGVDALRAALAAWSGDPFSSVRLRFAGVTSSEFGLLDNDGVNAFLFGDPNDEIAGSYDGSGILAIASPWFTCSTVTYDGRELHPILEADVVFQDGLDDLFAVVDHPERLARQLFGHQLGYTLGLAVSDDPEALMAPEIHPDLRGAALDVDDLAALAWLYATGQPPPPTVPEGLTADHAVGLGVELTWQPAQGASNYRVERAEGDDGTFEVLAAVSADGATALVDPRVLPDTTYRYRVRTQNALGRSAPSAVAAVHTPPQLAPAAPSHLRGAALSSDRVRLTWQDNACDETEQRLHVLHDGDFVEVPFALPADARSVLVSGLDPDTTYAFRLVARNDFGESPPSATAEVRTFALGNPCQVLTERLCLEGGRFAVEATYRLPGEADERDAKAVPNTDGSGFFWFFDARNLEMLVEVLDTTDVNGHFRVRASGLSDLAYTLRVTDTATGQVRAYEHAAGLPCGLDEPTAFAAGDVPLPAAAPRARAAGVDPRALVLDPRPLFTAGALRATHAPECERDPNELPLFDGRFRLELRWRDGEVERRAEAVDLTDTSGLFQLDGGGPERADWAVKVLDGRQLNDRFWLFHGPLPAVEGWLTVEDLDTGTTRVYYNPAGEICGAADVGAFAD